jgi:hypothetical protein
VAVGVDRVAPEDRVALAGGARGPGGGGAVAVGGRDGIEDERHRLVAVEGQRRPLGDEEPRAPRRPGRQVAGEPRLRHALAAQQPQPGIRIVQGVPEPDGARAGHPDVEDRPRVAEVRHRVLVVVPHPADAHCQPAIARRLRAHGAHRLAVLVAVVVGDEHVVDPVVIQPRRDRARTDAVVRGQAHERGAVQAGVGGHRRDLQQPGVPEDRRGAGHLRGVEVADVGERLLVARRAPRVGDGLLVAIGAGAVEDDELRGAAVGALECELRAAQHVAPGAGGRTGERQAHVDPAHGRESTPAPRGRRSRSRRR